MMGPLPLLAARADMVRRVAGWAADAVVLFAAAVLATLVPVVLAVVFLAAALVPVAVPVTFAVALVAAEVRRGVALAAVFFAEARVPVAFLVAPAVLVVALAPVARAADVAFIAPAFLAATAR